MKKESGITLSALSIYIIVMIIVMGVISSIINEFYKNTDNIQEDTEQILEFSKFNTYFLKEIKLKGNSVDSIDGEGKYILFTSGNSFSFDTDNNKIYYNNIQICKDVQSVDFRFGRTINSNEEIQVEDRSIINVSINFKEFNKSISYKVEEIY